MRFVPFDPDHVGCCIEPVFVDEVVGWQNEQLLIDENYLPVATWQKEDAPVAWVPTPYTRVPIEPQPIIQSVLKWREIDRH